MKKLQPQLRFPEFSGDWVEKKLVDISSIVDGDRGKNYPNTQDFYDDGYCLFLNAKNVTKNGFKFNSCVFIDREKDEALKKGKLVAGDVVITTRGSVGHVAFYDKKITFDHMRINSGMAIIRKFNFMDSKYLYKYLNSFLFQQQISVIVFGSAQPQLTIKEINKFNITYPQLKEQTKIANFLTAVDDKIDNLSKTLDSFKDYKKGMMHRIFSQEIRFKDEDGKDFPAWVEKMLRDVITTFSGGTPKTTNSKFYNGNIPFIGSGNIYSDSVFQHITKEGLEKSSAKIVKKGDLLFALYGATSGEVAISKIHGAINQAILCVRSKENIKFLLYTFQINKRKFLSTYLQGGQGNLSADIIKSCHVNFPTLQEQTKIANFLSAIDKKIENLTASLGSWKLFKKSLLQKMFV